jgi:DNA-binding NtrC family response regulator
MKKKLNTKSRGVGLVLVVEDEPIMRKIAVKVLKEAGYEVLIAGNGREGVELFEKHHNDIKLVLLDMVLPEKSGKDVYIEMKKIKPDVKVLLNSGFRKDKRVKEVLKLGVKHFIEKPYTFEALGKAIHAAVNG